ncbi:MAG: PKD domain-containing protein [Tannerella sp.]|jgi:PKD repeat protein|nr:PKD domain-containing protein [Tannerella sp.]
MKKVIRLSFLSALCAMAVSSCGDKEEPAPLSEADFSYAIDSENSLRVQFTNKSTNGESYSWNFGDQKGTSTEKDPQYTYTAGGTYVVSLTTANIEGKTHKKEQNVTVQTPAVVANFTYTVDEEDPLTVHFSNTSQNATVYSWNFGDNSSLVTETSPTHSYAASGTYTVTLTAQNNALESNAKNEPITVTATDEPEPETPVRVKVGTLYTPLLQVGSDEIYQAVVPFAATQQTFTVEISGSEYGFIWYSGNGGVGTVTSSHSSVPLAGIYVEKSIGRLAPITDEDLDTDPLWVNMPSAGNVLVRIDLSQIDNTPRYYLEWQKTADPNLILEQKFDLFVWGGHWPNYLGGSIPSPTDPASLDGTEVASRSGTGTAVGIGGTTPINTEVTAQATYLKNRDMEGWTANCTYEMAGYARLSNSVASGVEYRGILKTPALGSSATGVITVKYDICRFSATGPITFKVEGGGTISRVNYIDVIESGVTYGGSYVPVTTETPVTVGAGAVSFDMTTALSPAWSGVNNAIKYWTRFTVTVADATAATKIAWDATGATETSAQLRCCIDNISVTK